MFGISFPEFLFLLFLLVILVKPEDYPKIIKKIKEILFQARKIYASVSKEFDQIKEEFELDSKSKAISDLESKLRKDIDEAGNEIRKIIGDDGRIFEAHNIDELPTLSRKNRRQNY